MSAARVVFRSTLLIATAVLLLLPTASAAQENDERKRPRLGDHMFITNPITKEPFSRTYVSQDLGIGVATDIDFLPSFVIGEDTIDAISGDLMFATLALEYQHAIKNWLAVFGTVDLTGRLGTDAGALLSEGATVLTGFELGWLFKLVENEKVALSGTANVWNNGFTGVNLLNWVQGIVDDEPVELVRSVPSVRAGGGLRFAWAASDLIGVSARSEVGLGESIARRGEDQTSFLLSGALDVDLNARTSVPLGLVVGFETNNSPREGSELTDRVSRGLFRVAYTGREDFVIAADIKFNRLSIDDSTTEDNVSTAGFSLNMRYYF